MNYSTDIDNSLEALMRCLKKVNDGINDIWDWKVTVDTGCIDYGIYFNFNSEEKELEICNYPKYDDSLYLEEIIDAINGNEKDEDE